MEAYRTKRCTVAAIENPLKIVATMNAWSNMFMLPGCMVGETCCMWFVWFQRLKF